MLGLKAQMTPQDVPTLREVYQAREVEFPKPNKEAA
jgi:hypothetical protein